MPTARSNTTAMVDTRSRKPHPQAAAIERAARDVIAGTPAAVAARNRGVNVERVKAHVRALKEGP